MSNGLPRYILNAATEALPWPSERARGRILLAMLVLLTALLSFRSIEDLDYGIHLGTGRWILQNGKVPTNDPFTWSIPDHAYVAYHWGFQVLLAGLYQLMGHLGPVLLRFALVCLTALVVVRIIVGRGAHPIVAGVCGLLAIVATEWRFAMRPELFSNLFIVLTILCVDQWRAGSRRALWMIPLIFIGWINTHVYILGFFVLGAAMVEEILHRRSIKKLLLIAAISAVAIFLNPYGLEAVLEPLRLFTRMNRDNIFAQNISELASPIKVLLNIISPSQIFSDPFQPINQLLSWFALLILGGFAARELLSLRRHGDLIVLIALAALSCAAMRNIALFAIAGLPAIISGLTALVRSRNERWNAYERWAFGSLVVIASVISVRVATGAWYAQQRRNTHMAPVVERTTLAFGAAEFIEDARLVGRGFNNFNIGGSLLFGAPSHPIYIDGRNEVTGEEFFRHYLQLVDPQRFDAARFDSFMQSRDIEYIALGHGNMMHLVRYLLASQRWTVAFYDAVAVVFVRKDGPNGHIEAQPFATPLASLNERGAAIARINSRPMVIDSLSRWLLGGEKVPVDTDRVGTFLLTSGRWPEAERYLLASAIRAPNFWETSLNLGALYWRLKEWEGASNAYRTVLMLNPSNKLAKERFETCMAALKAELAANNKQGAP